MFTGKIDSMHKLGVQECLRVKECALLAASEAAELIMRVDNIIRCAPRKIYTSIYNDI
jgi:T-complex protein 1 subunit beta